MPRPARRRLVQGVPLLLAVVLLAGCVGSPPPSTPVKAAAAPASASPPPEATPTAPFDAKGTASFSVLGACVPLPPGTESCVGVTDDAPGHVKLPRNLTRVKLTLTWSAPVPALSTYRVVVEGGNASARGVSPLTLELPTLAAGEHAIFVFPDGVAGPTPEQTFDWALHGE